MNHLCYKTIFSKRLGTLVAVGEHACSQSKGQGASAASGAAGFFDARFVGTLALGFAFAAQELPEVPIDQFDQRLDAIVTERGVRLFG